jgi:Fic family protein
LQPEFEKLNRLIGAMLDTRPSRILTSPLALARALGDPYDPGRLTLFEKLFIELNRAPFADVPDQNTRAEQWMAFAFFEAYFSNYIEGTVFALADAARVIQTGAPMPSRDEDSHDILGTYKLVSDRREMQTTPADPASLIEILAHRHAILLGGRPPKQPGRFKAHNNRAGETHFVDDTLVRGTLIKGFDFYKALAHPFARAAYMMFLVSEVHPFANGNGRLARIMMNAELVHRGQSRIIIPTVYRDDYLGALRRLSRHGDPAAYVRMLQRAHQFSASITGEDMARMQVRLEAASAFSEPDEGMLGFI